MASFGGFPQNVTYQTVNVSSGGGSENLLINPRGLINQLNESQGNLSPHQYFCDGWKAGASGAEVYVDSDGFRLISGSIYQVVPQNLGAGVVLRANMDVVNGTPSIKLNGDNDQLTLNGTENISFEVTGTNCKFTRCILAEGASLPIYQQMADELPPCRRFLRSFYISASENDVVIGDFLRGSIDGYYEMHSTPALWGAFTERYNTKTNITLENRWLAQPESAANEMFFQFEGWLDARV